MNRTLTKLLCLALCAVMCFGMTACSVSDGTDLAKAAIQALAENEAIQNWFAEHDAASMTEEAIQKFKESIPALKEFLSREDVQEKFRTVGLPMLKEFLNYTSQSMRLKAETLANLIRIFTPELTSEVDDLFATAPDVETTAPAAG